MVMSYIFKEKTRDNDYLKTENFFNLNAGSRALSSACTFKCAIDCLIISKSAGHLGIAYAGYLSYVVLIVASMILCIDVALGIINRVGQLLS